MNETTKQILGFIFLFIFLGSFLFSRNINLLLGGEALAFIAIMLLLPKRTKKTKPSIF